VIGESETHEKNWKKGGRPGEAEGGGCHEMSLVQREGKGGSSVQGGSPRNGGLFSGREDGTRSLILSGSSLDPRRGKTQTGKKPIIKESRGGESLKLRRGGSGSKMSSI